MIVIPTYNEAENVEPMCAELLALSLNADILFIDDNSPDGTGEILDRLSAKHSSVRVMHRPGKQGIGRAHIAGIRYAYEHAYGMLVTMDCDFTHQPSDVPRLFEALPGADLVVGSRYLRSESLREWNIVRRFLTKTAHFLTTALLKLPQDTTGAFRVYNLETIPSELFDLVRANGYAFFFESLFTIVNNSFVVSEVPIDLPSRTYGHSKMDLGEISKSVRFLFKLYVAARIRPQAYRLAVRRGPQDDRLVDPQNWNAYWDTKGNTSRRVYGFIAAIYRNTIIRPQLTRAIRREFKRGANLLHAGCGSGQADMTVTLENRVTAVDISTSALDLYVHFNPAASAVEHADVFHLPFPDGAFDGAYNLGVVEHFTHEEIHGMLLELRRVLKPGGKVVIFWPHYRASSVLVLGLVHRILHRIFGERAPQLHPDEISLTRGRNEAAAILANACFQMDSYTFDFRDLFVQAVVVGKVID
ncbi:MAG: glycosyltransferase [Capsulimonadaceae bacterium]|nr:glycosyltransferase [Capsulimonadaceae bacterium]